jgi:hypothetical protein
MKIKPAFTFEPWSKVTKVFGRQCRRHFYIWDAMRKRCSILTFWPTGWHSGNTTPDGVYHSGWQAWEVHEAGHLKDSL